VESHSSVEMFCRDELELIIRFILHSLVLSSPASRQLEVVTSTWLSPIVAEQYRFDAALDLKKINNDA
jgi:hypothetical protein